MAKPGEIKYDFSKLEKSKEFQKFLNISLSGRADEVEIEKSLDASMRFDKRFVKPLSGQHFNDLFKMEKK